MPNRTEVIERLREFADLEDRGSDYSVKLADTLTQAADLLEAGHSRTEYRVVGRDGMGLRFENGPFYTLEGARFEARGRRDEESTGVRVQRSEVHGSRTPWTNLEEGEQ